MNLFAGISTDVYATTCRKLAGSSYRAQGARIVLWDNLLRWDGVRVGGRLKREGYMYTYV